MCLGMVLILGDWDPIHQLTLKSMSQGNYTKQFALVFPQYLS